MTQELEKQLLKLAEGSRASALDPEMVPKKLHLFYVASEVVKLEESFQKMIDARLKAGVSWDQMSHFYGRYTGAKTRFEKAQKRALKAKATFDGSPEDTALKKKLDSASVTFTKAKDELLLMQKLKQKVASMLAEAEKKVNSNKEIAHV